MVPGSIGQAGGGTGDGGTTKVQYRSSRSIEREFKEGAGATCTVLQKWLVCCGGLKPQSNRTAGGAIDSGVAVGTDVVIATIQSDGVAKFTG